MYAINILAPDYREMKHLHYFDHYFRNGLVNTIQEAIIMYRQEAYQEMVGMTLSSILSSINNLTGEVRALGMTLQSIQAEVTAIGQDSMHIRLLQEELLMTAQESAAATGALVAETRAQRYATEAVKENTDRLRWYEEQRYYGYL